MHPNILWLSCYYEYIAAMDWILGYKKTVSSRKFRTALVSVLISINFILFDKVSQTFLAKMVVILDIGEFCSPRQSISN